MTSEMVAAVAETPAEVASLPSGIGIVTGRRVKSTSVDQDGGITLLT